MLLCWQEMIIYEHNEYIVPVTVHQFKSLFLFLFLGVGNKTHGFAHVKHSLYNCAMY